MKYQLITAALATLVASAQVQPPPPGQTQAPDSAFRFKSGVELINVTVTVSDASGRFVPNLQKDDFLVYEDDQPQAVTHFSAERVPVSLGIALDTSGSMAGDKIRAAEGALDRFINDLPDKEDEIFLYLFSNYPRLVQTWTNDRTSIARVLGKISPSGGTALYDTVIEALPLAMKGQNRKKALVVITDGNDTASRADIREVKQRIRESEILVYAVGIDGDSEPMMRRAPTPLPPPRMPVPFPFPPRGRGRGWPSSQPAGQGGWSRAIGAGDRVNVAALRDMTDDSGGRTEIVREPRDLDPATSSISDELSKQYYLGYPSSGHKDGRWHSIRVELRAGNGNYHVRARRGYVAS